MEDEQRKRCFIRGYAIGEIIGSLKTNTREFAEDMIEHKLAGGILIKSLRFSSQVLQSVAFHQIR